MTEFVPISSTAHLRIVPELLGWEDPGAATSAVIQLGTSAALFAYFAKDLWRLARSVWGDLAAHTALASEDSRLAWAILFGSIPIGILGILLQSLIATSFRSLTVIAVALIAVALLLGITERTAPMNRGMESVTLRDGIFIGLWQALALIPGSSRSGTTLVGGLFRGLTREAAARFSFLLSIPATTAAGLFELRHVGRDSVNVDETLLATAVAFITGLLAIGGTLRFLRSHSTAVFIIYRIALGALILAKVYW